MTSLVNHQCLFPLPYYFVSGFLLLQYIGFPITSNPIRLLSIHSRLDSLTPHCLAGFSSPQCVEYLVPLHGLLLVKLGLVLRSIEFPFSSAVTGLLITHLQIHFFCTFSKVQLSTLQCLRQPFLLTGSVPFCCVILSTCRYPRVCARYCRVYRTEWGIILALKDFTIYWGGDREGQCLRGTVCMKAKCWLYYLPSNSFIIWHI